MGWILGLMLLAGVTGAVVFAVRQGLGSGGSRQEVFNQRAGNYEVVPGADRRALLTRVALGVGLGLMFLTTALASIRQVPAGNVGLVYLGGDIVGELDSGIHLVPPYERVRNVSVRTQAARFHPTDDKEKLQLGLAQISAGSVETQNIYIDATVNYQLDRGAVKRLYREVGPDWFNVLIPSRVQQITKAEVVKYEAVAVTQKREVIRAAVTKALDDELNQYGISVVGIQFDNVGYSAAFDNAIEEKQVATQNALKAQEVVAQREADARGTVATAKGGADANIEKARGDAEAIRITAEAQASANKELAASLTPALLQSQAIARMNVQVAILPSGGNFLLDPANLLKQLAPAQ